LTDNADAWINLLESMAPLREAAVGYRQQMLDHGFDDESASRCAADFHHLSVEQMLRTLPPSKASKR